MSDTDNVFKEQLDPETSGMGAAMLSAARYGGNFPLFVRAMIAADSDFDVVYFLEKPWKWNMEANAWYTFGLPKQPGDPGWRQFQQAVDRINNLLPPDPQSLRA
jgi:hypothetical protein